MRWRASTRFWAVRRRNAATSTSPKSKTGSRPAARIGDLAQVRVVVG
ncbi:hypothetical protein ACIHFD_61180 [Nonomuraea sp. NPDC051941]